MTTQDTTLPTVSLSCSSSAVTAAGDVTFSVTAADNAGIASVKLRRNDVPLTPKSVTSEFSQSLKFEDNGTLAIVADVTDNAGNVSTQTISLSVDIPSPIPCETFTNLPLNQSLASAAWDTAGRSWDPKTWMSGDGNGAAKIDSAQYGVCANYLSQAGDVGQAVFFTTTGARSSSGNLLSICIDGAGTTTSNAAVTCIEALLNGANYLYAKGDGKIAYTNYDIVPGQEYCLETCEADSLTYNVRLSKSANFVRGDVVASKQLVIATARAAGDRVVQLRTSIANKDILRITRVEALTAAFDVSGASATTTTTTTTAAPKTAPTFLFPETGAAIPGPEGLSFKFGPAGAPVPVEMIEKVYTDMPVGYAGVTQSRWMSRPITVNGIQFVLWPGLDSNGRADCWICSAFATASTQTNVNREHAFVEFRANYLGNDMDLWGSGTSYSYNHQRATTIQWETETMPWSATPAFINSMIQSGVFLKHDSRGAFGALENSSQTAIDEHPLFLPTIAFSSSVNSSGAPKYLQTDYVGDQYKGTSAGGERATIGFVHRTIARIISELGAKNNPSWLTPNRLKTAQYTAASIGQYPHVGGLIFPLDQRLIDPSQVPFSTHRNATAWGPCVGIPQPGMSGTGTDANYNAMYDNAHPANKISFHAWHFSRDYYHLFETQAQAVAALAYCTGGNRGPDGRILRITIEEERGFWWGLHAIIHAWHATPAGTMPKPFRDKQFFANAINNTLQFVRDNFMKPSAAYSGITYEAARFWRVLAPFTMSQYPGEIMFSPFMCDYGNQVLGEMLMLGYSAGRDVAEWHAENIRMRAQAGGNWYLPDNIVAANAGLAQSIGRTADTALPYFDITSYKAWYPRQTAYKDGALGTADWKVDWGRDTYMFMGVLDLYGELVKRGLITLAFDPVAEKQAFRNRHPGPYVSENGLPLNYEIDPKHLFSYSE